MAIDASLGTAKHIGYATVSNSPLYPGTGVNKSLPPIGDISLTGIVNCSSGDGFLSLQSTRLSVVHTMAQTIADGIYGIFI